jgi:hypothetical protein
MFRTCALALAAEVVVVAAVAPSRAADTAPPGPSRADGGREGVRIGLFDTLAPLSADAVRKGLSARQGWRALAVSDKDYRF